SPPPSPAAAAAPSPWRAPSPQLPLAFLACSLLCSSSAAPCPTGGLLSWQTRFSQAGQGAAATTRFSTGYGTSPGGQLARSGQVGGSNPQPERADVCTDSQGGTYSPVGEG